MTRSAESASRALAVLGNRWSLPAMRAVREEPLRFNALARAIDGVSHRMLAMTIRKLEQAEIIARRGDESAITYILTQTGSDLLRWVEAMPT